MQRSGSGFHNFYIMNVMQEYDPELDMLLFYLPIAGSAFKKCITTRTEPSGVEIHRARGFSGSLRGSRHPFKKESLCHLDEQKRLTTISGFYADVEFRGDVYVKSK